MSAKCRSLVILGASGNLALTKLYPSLYDLYLRGAMPHHYHIVGYARSEISNEKFREMVYENLKNHVDEMHLDNDMVLPFLESLYYVSGQYNSTEDFGHLKDELATLSECFPEVPRTIYYLSIPPAVFGPVADSLRESGAVIKGADSRQTVVVEKPFGYDTDTARELNETLYKTFDEEQIYRIDHYLGKEAVQNLMAMRFANVVFEPMWNKDYIESIEINWSEDKHIGSRGGYFDEAGIIRDVIQNHLLQILALVAMEKPASLAPKDIATEKIKVLGSIPVATAENAILGQYTDGVCAGKAVIGYVKEESVPNESKRETYAKLRFAINTDRWQGVPFYLSAGKALSKNLCEIVINFRKQDDDLFSDIYHKKNQLRIEVQPELGMHFTVNNKVPGNGTVIKDVDINFSYRDDFVGIPMPGAYERLLHDALNVDRTLFVAYQELIHSWEIFTPLLKVIDANEAEVSPYAAGTHGPADRNDI